MCLRTDKATWTGILTTCYFHNQAIDFHSTLTLREIFNHFRMLLFLWEILHKKSVSEVVIPELNCYITTTAIPYLGKSCAHRSCSSEDTASDVEPFSDPRLTKRSSGNEASSRYRRYWRARIFLRLAKTASGKCPVPPK